MLNTPKINIVCPIHSFGVPQGSTPKVCCSLGVLNTPEFLQCKLTLGECKSWTLDSGLDHGLDYGLEYGLNSRLIFKLLAMVTSQDLD